MIRLNFSLSLGPLSRQRKSAQFGGFVDDVCCQCLYNNVLSIGGAVIMILRMYDSGARGSVWQVVDWHQGLDVCINTSVSGCVSL